MLLIAATYPAGGPAAHSQSPLPAPLTLRRHFTPVDREAGRYQYLPIEVPKGVTRFTIEYDYDRQNGGTVIDLGLMEPGLLDLGTSSFRGWSGGARARVEVAANGSTPGYRDGAMPDGRWHVVLGLYKVAPAGVDVTVTARMMRGVNDANQFRGVGGSSGPASRSDGVPVVRWFSGAVHTHTVHSDGALTADQLVDLARDAGLDFVAITDHNNTTHTRDLTAGKMLTITGEEITTPGGHANALGLSRGDWIDFRVSPRETNAAAKMASLVDATHRRQGALFVINHPAADCDECAWTHDVPAGVDAVEIWNGTRDNGPQRQAVALWDRLLRSGRHVAAVGASDFHNRPTPLDQPSVRVEAAELSGATILRAIATGRMVVVRDARTPVPQVTASAGGASFGLGDTIRTCAAPLRVEVTAAGVPGGRAELIWNGDATASAALPGPLLFTRLCERGYARVNVYNAKGEIVAVTNPIYVEPSR